jgi:DNA-binding transcriptional MocR family regulator
MPASRRQEIAALARIHGVTIIEDDIYGVLAADAPPPLASYAPERSIHISGVSKCLAPCFRVGFAAVPADRIGRFSAAARALNWMAPPIAAEVVARWIADGTIHRLADRVRAETRERQRLAAEILEGFVLQTSPHSFHIWLHLPEPWRAQDMVAAARARGLAISPTELFVPGRAETPHAVRISVTAPYERAELVRGLTTLARVLREAPEPCLAVA